ncbi:hypothetical protein JHK84_031980 [Glycine max]|nr:hypothetical protein JHK84_031980 [Glycine max]
MSELTLRSSRSSRVDEVIYGLVDAHTQEILTTQSPSNSSFTSLLALDRVTSFTSPQTAPSPPNLITIRRQSLWSFVNYLGLKSARKRTVFSAFSGKRDELAMRACCAKSVHQYSLNIGMASRKRARTKDIPSSCIPTPLSAAIEPNVQHPQTLVPMLQSLFRGQLISMHSLRELAQNRPIIPLEYFLEKVACLKLNFHWGDPMRLLLWSSHRHRLN